MYIFSRNISFYVCAALSDNIFDLPNTDGILPGEMNVVCLGAFASLYESCTLNSMHVVALQVSGISSL